MLPVCGASWFMPGTARRRGSPRDVSSTVCHVKKQPRTADYVIFAGVGAATLAICGFAFLHDTSGEPVGVVLLAVALGIGIVMTLAGLVGAGVIRLRRD